MSEIYYLRWDRPGDGAAQERFHDYHLETPDTLARSEFYQLYDRVIDVETKDLEQLYAEWNRGSGYESQEFLELRYCDRCESYIEGVDEGVTHAAQNHGYDAFADSSEPGYIRPERSMSIGDIVKQGEQYYLCASVGWQELTIEDR